MIKAHKISALVFSCFVVLSLMASPSFAAEKTYTNSIGMKFVLIPAGTFLMGADKNFEKATQFNSPQHQVTISKPFYLGIYEVTQEQWHTVMGKNPATFKGRHNPVEKVSWNDVQSFIQALNKKEGHNRYRLPTEAEWEHAARAGTTTVYFFGHDEKLMGQYGWYKDNSSEQPHPVGQKQPNPWGVYDMLGNVYEWVQDWGSPYNDNPSTDPKGPSSGSSHVYRGGSWINVATDCRSSSRSSYQDRGESNIGFRLALSPE